MSSAKTPNRTSTDAARPRAELCPWPEVARTMEIGRVKRQAPMHIVARSRDRLTGPGWSEAV